MCVCAITCAKQRHWAIFFVISHFGLRNRIDARILENFFFYYVIIGINPPALNKKEKSECMTFTLQPSTSFRNRQYRDLLKTKEDHTFSISSSTSFSVVS